jgi:hypothetical protein
MKLLAKQTALQYAYDDVTRKLSNLPNPLPNPVKEVEWEAQLARLAAYKAEHGDCNVPRRRAEDRSLGAWVDNQRQRKKKLDCGEPGDGMTTERAARLEALGFAWGGTKASAEWEAQLARLAAYKARHGDCNVPQRWAEDPRLARWVNDQQRRKKLLDRGVPGNVPGNGMTAKRAAMLEALGFAWAVKILIFYCPRR